MLAFITQALVPTVMYVFLFLVVSCKTFYIGLASVHFYLMTNAMFVRGWPSCQCFVLWRSTRMGQTLLLMLLIHGVTDTSLLYCLFVGDVLRYSIMRATESIYLHLKMEGRERFIGFEHEDA
jgi:hypothetical protein